MARRETISQPELTERLDRVFRDAGYAGASLAMLSKAAGLAKAALYHRFPGGKEAIAHSVLEATARRMEDTVLGALAGPGTPQERLAAMVDALGRFYDGGARGCLADLFSIGDAPQSVREPLCAGLRTWIAAIAGVLAEAGFDAERADRRAEDAVVRIEGALVVARATGDTTCFRRVCETLAADLLSP